MPLFGQNTVLLLNLLFLKYQSSQKYDIVVVFVEKKCIFKIYFIFLGEKQNKTKTLWVYKWNWTLKISIFIILLYKALFSGFTSIVLIFTIDVVKIEKKILYKENSNCVRLGLCKTVKLVYYDNFRPDFLSFIF